MKAKKLKEALLQMAEEGVVQLFSPEDGSPAIVGVVGALQLDVLKERLSVEYTLPVDFEMARFTVCRWITADDQAECPRFIEAHRGDIARDLDNDPVFLAPHEFSLNYEAERWKQSASRRSRTIRSATKRLRTSAYEAGRYLDGGRLRPLLVLFAIVGLCRFFAAGPELLDFLFGQVLDADEPVLAPCRRG